MVLGVLGVEVYGFRVLGFSQISETFREGSLHTSTPRFRVYTTTRETPSRSPTGPG